MPRVGSPILVHRLWVALLIFCLHRAAAPCGRFSCDPPFPRQGPTLPDARSPRAVALVGCPDGAVSPPFPLGLLLDSRPSPSVRPPGRLFAELHDPFDLHLHNDIALEEPSFSEEDESRSRVAKPALPLGGSHLLHRSWPRAEWHSRHLHSSLAKLRRDFHHLPIPPHPCSNAGPVDIPTRGTQPGRPCCPASQPR